MSAREPDHFTTEDGATVRVGDRVYNYYEMKPGVIDRFVGYMPDAWFDVKHDDGTVSVLNGQRICSMAFAQRRGFKNAS